MINFHKSACFCAALCLTAFISSASPAPLSAAADKKITIGYYDDVPEFQSGASETDRKSGYAYEYYQELAKYTGWTYEYIYGSFDEITALMSKGEIDMTAGISEDFCTDHLKNGYTVSEYRTGTVNPDFFTIPGASSGGDFYIAVLSSDKDISSKLTEAQKLINKRDPSLCDRLAEKYFYSGSDIPDYTFDEKNWLGSHSTVMIGYLDNYMPYSNKSESTNSADGAMVRIFSALNKIIGKSISAVKFTSYAELYDALENGDIDAMFPACRDLWRLEHENILSTRSVISDHMVAVTPKNCEKYNRIALLATSPVQSLYIEDNYPDAETVHFNDTSACIKALRKGNADAFIVEENVLNYYLSDGKDISDLEKTTLDSGIDFCFAVKKSNSALCRILENSLSEMDSSVTEKAINENLYRKNDFTFVEFFLHNIFRVLIVVISVAAIAVLVFVGNRRKLRKKQNEIDEAMQTLSESEKETSKYREKTERDHLTGVFSRGYFTELAVQKIQSHRPNDTLQLVMMDIDNFKSVNDTYGHDNGDVVLVRLGEILKEIARVNGFAGRFGGEEFFIFLYGDNPEIQEHIVSQVCKKLRETDFDFTDRHITMSVGITKIKDDDTLDSCIERADKALYYSKKHGKNQYNWYEDVIAPSEEK